MLDNDTLHLCTNDVTSKSFFIGPSDFGCSFAWIWYTSFRKLSKFINRYCPFVAYRTWFVRVEVIIGYIWRTWGIYEMIMKSNQNIVWEPLVLSSLYHYFHVILFQLKGKLGVIDMSGHLWFLIIWFQYISWSFG